MTVRDGASATAPWQPGRHGGRVRLAAWTDRQGTALLATAGSDGSLAVWQVNRDGSVQPGPVLRGQDAAIFSVTFWDGPQGLRLLSGGTDSDVYLWDPINGTLIERIAVGDSGTRALLCWSNTRGHQLAVGGYDGVVRLIDLETGGRMSDSAFGHAAPVASLHSWNHADGNVTLVSGGDDGSILFWNPSTGAPAGPALERPGSGAIHAITSWPHTDGTRILAAGTSDGTVDLWDAAGMLIDSRRFHSTSVLVLGSWVTPDGDVVLCAGDSAGTLHIRDAATGQPCNPIDQFQTTGTPSTGGLTVWAPAENEVRLAVSGSDGTVRIWDATSADVVHDIGTRHVAAIWALACWEQDADSAYVASAGTGGTIRIWDLDTGRLVDDSLRHEPGVWALQAATDQQGNTYLISGGLDGDIRIWDARQREPASSTIRAHTSSVSALASWTDSAGQMRLASVGDDSKLGLWSPHTNATPTGTFAGHDGGLVGLAHWRTKDGHDRLATSGADKIIRVWDPLTADVLSEINTKGPTGTWSLCSWPSPGGQPRVASAHADGAIRIWDPDQDRLIHELAAGSGDHAVVLTAWRHSNGQHFLASGGTLGVMDLWDPETGRRLGEPLRGHRGGIRAITSLSRPNGSVWLASAGDDGTIRLWDPERRAVVRTVELGPLRTWGLSDAPAECDVIGRQVLINALVDQLKPDPDGISGRPLVVAVEGPWGSGKTTLMRLVQRGLATVSERRHPSATPVKRLTVRDAIRMLQRYPDGEPIPADDAERPTRFVASAWFNPWAHQSGEQIWAGLTEAIMGAVAPILYPTTAHRERYWFTRNLSRMDRHAMRHALRRRITSPLLRIALLAAAVPIAVATAQRWQGQQFLNFPINAATVALLIPLGLLIAGVVQTAARYWWGLAAKYLPSAVFNGPITTPGDNVGFGTDTGPTSYIDPLRQATRGSLYLYQHDVNLLISDLTRADTELIVFIDDLDRCRPSTTAEVAEAINLFLSGVGAQALRARFVVGMDPSVVATHLDQVYSALDRGHLAVTNEDPSPGWAFLRKLVQLPVAVPRIQDEAGTGFIAVALGMGPAAVASAFPTAAAATPPGPSTRSVSAAPERSGSPPPSPPISLPAEQVIPWRSIEQHPSIHSFLAERVNAQPDRSVREIKRIINVWQFYHRMLSQLHPLEDTEETIRRATALVLLAEMVTRWPSLQPHLHMRHEGQSGMHRLTASAHDDEAWDRAVTDLQLDMSTHGRALQGLRNILRRYDCTMVSDLTDFLH